MVTWEKMCKVAMVTIGKKCIAAMVTNDWKQDKENCIEDEYWLQ